ncbi:MAG: nitroreductase [Hyphomicrobiaceae bacterium]
MASHELLAVLKTRRSSKPALLVDPGPSRDQLSEILMCAARVPDHKKLAPWRFVVFEGPARRTFGLHLERIAADRFPEEATEMRRETERNRFLRAPVVIAVISSPKMTDRVPEIEQVLSCGAACYNLCLAANAMGFGTSWITEWYSYDPGIAAVMGLEAHEKVAGFIYIGTAREAQPDRDRPDVGALTTYFPA